WNRSNGCSLGPSEKYIRRYVLFLFALPLSRSINKAFECTANHVPIVGCPTYEKTTVSDYVIGSKFSDGFCPKASEGKGRNKEQTHRCGLFRRHTTSRRRR